MIQAKINPACGLDIEYYNFHSNMHSKESLNEFALIGKHQTWSITVVNNHMIELLKRIILFMLRPEMTSPTDPVKNTDL